VLGSPGSRVCGLEPSTHANQNDYNPREKCQTPGFAHALSEGAQCTRSEGNEAVRLQLFVRNKKPISARSSPVIADRRFDVVAIGASAGGLSVLMEVLAPIPPEFPASILIVQHLHPMRKSMLASLLGTKTALHVKQAEHGEPLLPGIVYVAPPDEHLLVGPGKVQLVHSQLVHFSRPSIDLLFESVAGTYGARCIGIVLTGSGQDGSAGIRAIKEAGGTTIVQDPVHSEFRLMPDAAVATGCVDLVLAAAKIGETVAQLCSGRSGNKRHR
jgi:two-component system, chemotaxis family, protein-glutamate methylesterase/glutaminase